MILLIFIIIIVFLFLFSKFVSVNVFIVCDGNSVSSLSNVEK